MAGFEPATSGVRTALTTDICIIQETNDCTALWTLRVMGNLRRRKKNDYYWIDYFPSEKKFSTEKNNDPYIEGDNTGDEFRTKSICKKNDEI